MTGEGICKGYTPGFHAQGSDAFFRLHYPDGKMNVWVLKNGVVEPSPDLSGSLHWEDKGDGTVCVSGSLSGDPCAEHLAKNGFCVGKK